MTPAREHRRPPALARVAQPGRARPATIQRSARCACGGGCPRCAQGRTDAAAPHVLSMPGDPLEREADRVAEAVTGSKAAQFDEALRSAGAPVLRKIEPAHGGLQAEPIGELLSGSGEALSPAIRASFEPRFGVDFSAVRVHADGAAARSAASLQAAAYTVGQHLVFGAGHYAPGSSAGRRLIAHELAHVVQQSGGAGGGNTPAPGLVQREGAPGTSGVRRTGPANPGVSSDKWRADLEAAYRRAGYSEAADAVSNCRNWGACDHILTLHEAWEAYRRGRVEAKLGDPPESAPGPGTSGNNVVVAAGMTVPVALGGGGASAATETAVAKTALERASIQWGTRAAIMEGGAAATEGTAAATAGASAGAVAVPVAIGVVLVMATIDLIGWGRFQTKLQKMGYTILPDPLGTCIGNCHHASETRAPTFGTSGFGPTSGTFTTLTPSSPMSPFQPMSPDDIKAIEDWIAPRPEAKTGPSTSSPPVPRPDPDVELDRRRRRGCRYESVAQQTGAYHCHAAFATALSGTGREMRVTTPEGESADFDAMNLAEDLFEVKTGYRWLPFTPNPVSVQSTLTRFYAQATNQMIIAGRCGHRLNWYFNDPYAASFFGAENSPYPQYLRAPMPVPVWYVPFNCDQDSG